MVTIDGDEIVSGSTIDGDEISEITMDGDVVWTAGPAEVVYDEPGVYEEDVSDLNDVVTCEVYGAIGANGRSSGLGDATAGSGGGGSSALLGDSTELAEASGGGGGGGVGDGDGDEFIIGGAGGDGGFAEIEIDLNDFETLEIHVADSGVIGDQLGNGGDGGSGFASGNDGDAAGSSTGGDGGSGGFLNGTSPSGGSGGSSGSNGGDADDGGAVVLSPATELQTQTGFWDDGSGEVRLFTND